jgi:hypothetical protein
MPRRPLDTHASSASAATVRPTTRPPNPPVRHDRLVRIGFSRHSSRGRLPRLLFRSLDVVALLLAAGRGGLLLATVADEHCQLAVGCLAERSESRTCYLASRASHFVSHLFLSRVVLGPVQAPCDLTVVPPGLLYNGVASGKVRFEPGCT